MSKAPSPLEPTSSKGSFVAWSPGRALARELAVKAAPSASPVLISGPAGAGRGALARDIHHMGPRAGGPFVIVRCDVTDHDAGAPPSGQEVLARAAEAGEGTLLLKEVTELSKSAQGHVLHLLERGRGPRIIATCSGSPERRLTTSLYYRLGVLRIAVPALGPEDVRGLTFALAPEAEEKSHASFFEGELDAIARLALKQRWLGGAHELGAALERYLVYRDARATVEDNWASCTAVNEEPPRVSPGSAESMREAMDRIENLFRLHVAQSEPNVGKLAVACGVSDQTIYAWLRRVSLRAPDLRSEGALTEAIRRERDALGEHKGWLLALLNE